MQEDEIRKASESPLDNSDKFSLMNAEPKALGAIQSCSLGVTLLEKQLGSLNFRCRVGSYTCMGKIAMGQHIYAGVHPFTANKLCVCRTGTTNNRQ